MGGCGDLERDMARWGMWFEDNWGWNGPGRGWGMRFEDGAVSSWEMGLRRGWDKGRKMGFYHW